MQKLSLTLLVVAGIAASAAAQSNTAYTTEIGPLLTTQWGQRGVYAKLVPNKVRSGCWAAAIAQMLYFHRVQPSGAVPFWHEGGQSNTLVELDHQFDWNLFVDSVSNSTPMASQDEVATYVYYTFLAIEGTMSAPTNVQPPMAHSDRARAGLRKYFDCSTGRIRSGDAGGMEAVEKMVLSELTANRPLMLYAPPHAFVIDGVRVGGKGLEVHLNCGWGGFANGWYVFREPFATHPGRPPLGGTDRYVLLVHPNAQRAADEREAGVRNREAATKARADAAEAREAAKRDREAGTKVRADAAEAREAAKSKGTAAPN